MADPGAAFYVELQERYGLRVGTGDADVRVVVTVRPTSYVAVDGGMTTAEIAAARAAKPAQA